MRELTHDIAKILVNGMMFVINVIILFINKYIINTPLPKFLTTTNTNPSSESTFDKIENVENNDIEDSTEQYTEFFPV